MSGLPLAPAPPAPARGDDGLDLCALVSARLCHDLVSPLGAIGNGLELIEMTGPGRSGAEIALISDSLANALGKLRFLRIAFGPADPGARQSFEEASSITSAAFQGRFSVAWAQPDGDMPRLFAKLIYLAILCLEKSLPLGGEVRIETDGATTTLRVEGRRTSPPAEHWAYALGRTALGPASSDAVQFTLLRAALESSGATLAANFTETSALVTLRAAPPA